MRTLIALGIALAGLAACGEAELDEVPEAAEVETQPLEGEVRYDEEVGIGLADLAETLMLTGAVVGTLESGFFLRTEEEQVLFVQSDAPVTEGQNLRVYGMVIEIQARHVDEWETEALEREIDAFQDVDTSVYLDATEVEPIEG